MSLEQSVAANTNWINSVIAKSKLSSELTELIKIINSNQRVVVQEGSNDAEFVKIPNLRGFSGFWNAQTNTPVLSNGTGVSGDVYSVSVGGLMDLGSGQISFEVGDLIYYNGVKWFNLNNNSSVNITGTQSIGGEKTFLNKLRVEGNLPEIELYDNEELEGSSIKYDPYAHEVIFDSTVFLPSVRTEVDGRVSGGDFKLYNLNSAPSSSTATGALGEIRYTADYIYVCTATDTWKRTALTTW